ncbi:MAG: hypothetical protein R2766_07595 [Saprospiraceae bacterium]
METHTLNERERRLEPLGKACQFCDLNRESESMSQNSFISVYKENKRLNLLVYRNVKFNEIKIGIPRCNYCSRTHGFAKIIGWISTIVAVLGTFFIPFYLAVKLDLHTIMMFVFMVLSFGAGVGLVYGLQYLILNLRKVKSEKEVAKKEPLIREFLRNGWSLDRPRA